MWKGQICKKWPRHISVKSWVLDFIPWILFMLEMQYYSREHQSCFTLIFEIILSSLLSLTLNRVGLAYKTEKLWAPPALRNIKKDILQEMEEGQYNL